MLRRLRMFACLLVLTLHAAASLGLAEGWVRCTHADGASRLESPDQRADCHDCAVPRTGESINAAPCEDVAVRQISAAAQVVSLRHAVSAGVLVVVPPVLRVPVAVTNHRPSPAAPHIVNVDRVALRSVVLVV